MKRPYLQLYVADWQSNAKLRSCTRNERQIWLEIMFLLHDQEVEYGIVRWPLKQLAQAVHAPVRSLQTLIDRRIMKGADVGQRCEPFVYVPRSGGKDGAPVILIPEQSGPIWYSSRMVRDEYKRQVRSDNEPKSLRRLREEEAALKVGLGVHPSRAQTSISDSEVFKDPLAGVVVDPHDVQAAEQNRGYPFDHFAVVEYAETLRPDPPLSIFQAETIAQAVTDSPRSRAVWSDVLRIFKGNGYQRRHAGNAVDRYGSEMAKIAEGQREEPPALRGQASDQDKQRKQEELERNWRGARSI